MSDFALAQARGGTPEALAADCAAQLGAHAPAKPFNLGFVYATSPLAGTFASIVDGLRNRTGIAHWVGTVGHGICATGSECFEQPAIVALAGHFPDGSAEILASVTKPDAIAAKTSLAMVGVVHGDPRSSTLIETVAELAAQRGVYLVGGLTSADAAFPQAAGTRIADGGVSGVLLGGKGIDIALGLTQGCSPIGPVHTVTQGEGQVLVTLDGRPAYEVLREDAGAKADANPRTWVGNLHAALPVKGSDRADYVVRNLVGIGPEQGVVAVADNFEPGDRVLFVRRDRASAERDLERMLGELKGRVKAPKAGLYFSCLARGPNLFQDEAHEMKAIQRAFGDIPIAGFYGNGEIANNRVYGYTGVLTLFS